jgi:PAS domain S-box-containing protein
MLAWATVQVAIVGPDGHLMSTTIERNPQPIDLSDREHIRVHLEHRLTGLFIGKPVLGRVSHRITIQVTRRVDGADGRLLGIIAFSLSPQDLTGLNRTIDLGRHGVINLTRLDNIILARFTQDDPTGLDGIGYSITGGPRPLSFPDGAEGTYARNGAIDHVKRLVAYRRIPKYPLVATVGLEVNQILAAPHAHELLIVAISGLATVLMLWLGAYLISEIHRRARQVMELAAERGRLQDDIRRRERVESQLREAQATLNDAVESISEAFVIYDAEDRFVLCNEPYRKLYPESPELLVPGVSFETLVRRSVETGRNLPAIGCEEEWIAERLESHRHPSGALEAFLADGRCLLITERRMRNGGTAGLRIDITRLKATETQLRGMADSLDRVQRIAGIGSVEIELPNGRISWSAGACAIFGVSAQPVASAINFFLSFVHPDDRTCVAEAAARSRATGIAAPALEYRIIRPDGTERIVYRENAVQYDANGRAVRRIITLKDITDLKAAEMQLRAIKKNLDRAQRLAHTGVLCTIYPERIPSGPTKPLGSLASIVATLL